jgi:tRNA threonylcarbamoyladenosine biosynthesis protein TsaB
MSPIILTIQTASPAGSVSVSKGDQLLAELNLEVRKTASEWLLPSIEDLIDKAGLSRDDLDVVAVVRGPGSFTGLRVGLATAKGLAMASGCPLVGVSSLQCLAMQAPFVQLPVCVMMDARKQEVYTATYQWEHGYPHQVSEESVLKPDDILAELKGETLFIGNGATVYRTLIVKHLAERAHFVPGYLALPRAGAAAALALREWEAGNTFSAEELMPVYLRPSEAELNYRSQGNSG